LNNNLRVESVEGKGSIFSFSLPFHCDKTNDDNDCNAFEEDYPIANFPGIERKVPPKLILFQNDNSSFTYMTSTAGKNLQTMGKGLSPELQGNQPNSAQSKSIKMRFTLVPKEILANPNKRSIVLAPLSSNPVSSNETPGIQSPI